MENSNISYRQAIKCLTFLFKKTQLNTLNSQNTPKFAHPVSYLQTCTCYLSRHLYFNIIPANYGESVSVLRTPEEDSSAAKIQTHTLSHTCCIQL